MSSSVVMSPLNLYIIKQPISKVHFCWPSLAYKLHSRCARPNQLMAEEKAKLASSRHSNLKTAAGDENLKDIFHQIRTSKAPAVINYGASWCRVCSQILPAFCQLSDKFPKLSFVYADIDECPETTQHIRYTPTFHFYRDGERVDEMYGTGEERLHDRLWLHS